MITDIPFVECTPPIFRQTVADYGVVILRSAIARSKIADFKRRLELILNTCLTLNEENIDRWNWQTWWPGNPKSFSLGMSRNGEPNDNTVREISGGTLSFYDLISDPAFHGLMAGAFPGVVFRSSVVAHCRLMKDIPGAGVKLHSDIKYHREGPFTLNFWTPLEGAGEQFGTSGLEIWPVGFRTMMRYLDHDGIAATGIDLDDKKMEAIPQIFGAPIRTNIDAGDVMVINSWTPHRTYIPEGSRDRLSVEVRLTADKRPPERAVDWLRKRVIPAINPAR